MKHLFYTLGLFLLICTISGCDNNDLLLSEKKLNRNIQRTWKFVLPTPSSDGQTVELWTFKDGTVTLKIKEKSLVDTITFLGKYSVDARFSKAYVSLSDFAFTGVNYLTPNSQVTELALNRRWDLVELDNPVLYLASTNDKGTLQSLEFVEK